MFQINEQRNSIPVNGQNQCFREQGRQYLRGLDCHYSLEKNPIFCLVFCLFFWANAIVLPWWKQTFIDFIENFAYLRSMRLVFYFDHILCSDVIIGGFLFIAFFSFFPKVLNSFVIRNPQNSICLISDFWAVSRCCQGTLWKDHFTLSQLFPLLQQYLVSSSDHRGCCNLLVGK